MIFVFVEHFLNEEGKAYFPKWLKELSSVLPNHEGFVSIEKIEDVENDERSLLMLKFKDYELLRKWSKSDEHDKMLSLLRKYMLRKQYSQILKTGIFEREY